MISLPFPMIEMSNGMLMVLFAYKAAFAILFLTMKWNDARERYRGPQGWARAMKSVYREQKPAISITVTIIGLFLRTVPLWYFRHVLDHHQTPLPIAKDTAMIVFWVGTLMIVLGIMCWIRVVSPFKRANMVWVGMTALAVIFAIYMAN